MNNLIKGAKSPKGSALKTIFINTPEAREAFKAWYHQGDAPTNGDILEYDYDNVDFELFYHLANYMFEAGRKHERAVYTDLNIRSNIDETIQKG